MSIVTQVKLRDGTYVSAMECVRNGDWRPIERAFTELYEELKAARRTVSGQEAVAEIVRYETFTGRTAWDIKVRDKSLKNGALLYAAPIPATELSDDDLRKLAFKHCYATTDANGWIFAAELDRGLRDFASAILAAKEPK